MTNYTTTVSNNQWQIISKFLDLKWARLYYLREIVNAIFYLVKSGCQWRLLPSDFPKWQFIQYNFSLWKKNQIWEQIHEFLEEKIWKIARQIEETHGRYYGGASSEVNSCKLRG